MKTQKLILFLILMGMSMISYSQYYFGATTIPEIATENDSITVVDTFHLTMSNDYKINTVITKTPDTITIHMCYYYAGGLALAPTQIEYTNIGKLVPGQYIVKIEGAMTQNFSCSPSFDFINSVTFPLQVIANPTVINETIEEQIKFGSQLIHDRLVFDTLPLSSSIKIYDIQGRYLYSHDNDEKQLIIETSNWTKGIYVVSIQTNGEHKRWRVIKE